MADDEDYGVTRDLLSGDEDISPLAFSAAEAAEPDFGNWPEIVGAVATALLIWFSFAFTG